MTEVEEIVAYLQSLPTGGVVKWADDHLCENRPWCASWVDVRLEDDAMRQLKMNWVWTIDNPNDPNAGGDSSEPWCFAVEHDLDVHRVWDEKTFWYVNELAVPKGSSLPHSAVEMYRSFDQLGLYVVHGGWSPERISNALRAWSVAHAGRGDLCFEWAPGDIGLSVMAREAEETLASIKDGAESYEIAPNIKVTDQVMDMLLAMPADEAAELTTQIGSTIFPFRQETE